MTETSLALGIDLGTSGVKISVVKENGSTKYFASTNYKQGLCFPNDWRDCCLELLKKLPSEIKKQLVAISIDGTSGTLMACQLNGTPIGKAIPYHYSCLDQKKFVKQLINENDSLATSISSIAKALTLIKENNTEKLLLRHQADWIHGWLAEDWRYGEEANNLKFGWDINKKRWPTSFNQRSWIGALPEIVPSGTIVGRISKDLANKLDLSCNIVIVTGTTDSNAAVLAARPNKDEGITILGSTVVIKSFVENPINDKYITNHLLDDRWICGGSSNTGGAVLKKFFQDDELSELSRQINPDKDSGISLIPLPFKGERFPINDPNLEPILTPRPISDSLYLHALFEGMANIEAKGWEYLFNLGVSKPRRIVTIGGGAKNPQWRRIRERIINIPIRSCKTPPSAGVANLAMKAYKKGSLKIRST